jgi:hypothetical protein
LAGPTVAGGGCVLIADALPVASIRTRAAAGAVSATGIPTGGLESASAGTPARGRAAAFASDGEVHPGKRISGGMHSGGGGADRVGGNPVTDHELRLHDLAGPAGHDKSDVTEVRVVDARLEGRTGRRLVGVDGLHGLVHEPVRRFDQIGRGSAAGNGLNGCGSWRGAWDAACG